MRLFVAFELREDVREEMRGLIATLKPKGADARWVRPEGMHITLKFIGHQEPAKLEAIQGALASVHCAGPVEMCFSGVGFFPDGRRPRVVWCGIEASPNLAQLAADIESVLEPLGIDSESRRFSPHLTLARLNAPSRTEGLVRSADEWRSREFGSAAEREFHLFESTTKPTGAVYKKLASFVFIKESR